MTLLIENYSEEIPCSHCDRLRKIFKLIAISAVLPMLFFAALLLLVVSGKSDAALEDPTSFIVEFVFGLLYVQLFVATSILIVSFLKRREPMFKYHYWYLFFHVVVIGLFLCSCVVMAAVNEAYAPCCVVLICGGIYLYILHSMMDGNRKSWSALRRAY